MDTSRVDGVKAPLHNGTPRYAPVHAQFQCSIEGRSRGGYDASTTHTNRDMIEQLLRERLAVFTNIFFKQIRPQQSNATVDVKSDASRRDDRLGIVAVEGGHTTDREAVAAMQVRHTHRAAHDAGQGGHVRDLFYGWEEPSMSSGGALLLQFVKN